MSQNSLVRGAASNIRFDDYIRAMSTKDYSAITSIFTNTQGILQSSLAQLALISAAIDKDAKDANAASVSANSASASAFSSSKNAKTSEVNAGASADQANTSYTNTQALLTQCDQIKTDCENIQTVTQSLLRSFARTWLGELAEDPTQTQFGDAIVVGAEYYNTTTKRIRIYTADGWVNQDASAESNIYSAQLLLAQVQTLAAQVQQQADQMTAQLNTCVRNNYGLSTGKYGIYAGLYDSTYTAIGKTGGVAWCYRGTNGSDNWVYMSTQADILAETTARTSAVTQLENEKVNRAGDTMTGALNTNNWINAGANGGWQGSTTVGQVRYTAGISFGNPNNAGAFIGTLQVTDVNNNGADNKSGVHLQGFDGAKSVYDWYFAWNGNIVTPKGTVAFQADLTTESTTRASADTALENEKLNRNADTATNLTVSGSFYIKSADGVNQVHIYSDNGTTGGGNDLVFQQGTSSYTVFGQDGNITTTIGKVAFSADLVSESATRASAVTQLENEKVNRSGDTVTGDLSIKGNVNTGSATKYTKITYGPNGTYASFQNDGNFVGYDSTGTVWALQRSGFMYLGYRVLTTPDMTAESTARSNAVTQLENEKVNRSGDNMTWLGVGTTLYINSSDGKGQGRIYADSSNTLWMGLGGQNTGFKSDGSISTSKGNVAFASDVSNEATTRANAVTQLENEKSNLNGGNTFNGNQYVNGWVCGGYKGGFNNSSPAKLEYIWTQGVQFGNPYGGGNFYGTLGVTDVYGNGQDNRAGINLTGYDLTGAAYQWYFAWNGSITTPRGTLAFDSDKVNRGGDTMTGGLTLDNNWSGVTAQISPGSPTTGTYVNYPGFSSIAKGRGGEVHFQLQEAVGSRFSGLISLRNGDGSWRYLGIPAGLRINDSQFGDVAYVSDLNNYVSAATYSGDFSSGDGSVITLPYGKCIQFFNINVPGNGSNSHRITFPRAFSGTPSVAFVGDDRSNSRSFSLSSKSFPDNTGFYLAVSGHGNSTYGDTDDVYLTVIAIGPR